MLKRQKGSECLNCGQDIGDSNYCSNCGQVNDTRRLTFIELIGESLSNFFAVDGRIFRTLRDVLIKPGKRKTRTYGQLRATARPSPGEDLGKWTQAATASTNL